ncbi:hypothetical protein [Mesorhizobium sp.]|uniref:hypothetical protein n=1 Tax=Mesorhizobium sp. TaxID=1871066 RepID=UPI0025C1E4FA|nr:hypothetical protein [Mesorhizobium sp.]
MPGLVAVQRPALAWGSHGTRGHHFSAGPGGPPVIAAIALTGANLGELRDAFAWIGVDEALGAAAWRALE